MGSRKETIRLSGIMNNFLTFLLCLTVLSFVSSFKVSETVPHWVELCGEGHAYVFSTESTTWANAKGTCEVMGGTLAKIETIEENSCLVKYALSTGLEEWWWHHGNNTDSFLCSCSFIKL